MKKVGFTLAEVLITLTIVGIVAAITLPALQTNITKQQQEVAIKKAYNTVTEAVALYLADQQVSDLTETPLYMSQEGLKEFVNNYFRVQYDCGTRGFIDDFHCTPEKYWSLDKTNSANTAQGQCGAQVILADGMGMCFDSSYEVNAFKDKDKDGNEYDVFAAVYGENYFSAQRALTVQVDTNGKKGPNMSGRDWFHMDVKSNGIVYEADFDITKKSTWYNDHKSVPAPMGLGMLQSDDWKMKY